MQENESALPPEQPPENTGITRPEVRNKAPLGLQMLLGFTSFLLMLGSAAFLLIGWARPVGFLTTLALFLFGLGIFIIIRRSNRGPGLWRGFIIGIALLVGLGLIAFTLCVSQINSRN
jgi:hypothetical protein